MTLTMKRAIATWCLWVGLGCYFGLFVTSLAEGRAVRAAGFLVVVILMAACLPLSARLDDWIDAKVETARAQLDLNQTALAVMRDQRRAGNARVTFSGSGMSVN